MNPSRAAWRDDFERVTVALEPYAVAADDGSLYVSEEAPPPLVDVYSRLISMGYAFGWLTRDEED